MKFKWIVSVLLLWCSSAGVSMSMAVNTDAVISLEGTWRFAMDRTDSGIREQWHLRDLTDHIILPGVLQAQGYGDDISTDTPWVLSLYDRNWYLRKEFRKYGQSDEVKVPFLCQPPKHYLGAAWYQRDIDIPENWKGLRVGLVLERTRWKSTLWIDDQKIGSQDSLVVPHYYELGRLAPGRHRLTLRVDNRMLMDYRPDAHSVSDSLGSSWNGIVGRIQLYGTSCVWMDEIQAFGDVDKKTVSLRVRIGNITGQPGTGILSVGQVSVPVTWTADGGTAQIVAALGDETPLWSEFNPHLINLTVSLRGDQAQDSRRLSLGLRRISTDGANLLINGRKSHLRGTHSGGDFPKTGYPRTDVDYWRKLFMTCKEWGLNHMRFHSFCPPEAAFAAADELGVYLQPECGMWNTISPGTEMEKRMYAETERMIREYGNHPSFVLFSPSNEPKGRWKESLTSWVEHYRQQDPRRLYTTGTGWPLIESPGPVEGADFLAVHRIGPRPVRGNRAWFGSHYLSSIKGVDVPIIVHELGQWCAYPEFGVIDKFTGYLRPGNFEIFRDSLEAAGLLDMNAAFAEASGRLQTACYKEEIEANLRTPGLAGFQLLDLHDYVGQGTALVGVLDAFWEEKGYVTASQWRRFCNTTVPLAVLKERVFTTADNFNTDILIAHYGPAPLTNVTMYWQIRDMQNEVIQQDQWTVDEVSHGSAIPIGTVKADLSTLKSPAAYKLVVGLSGTSFENDWNFWVYPADPKLQASADVLVTRSFDQAKDALQKGQTVLLMPLASELHWSCPPIGREPVFWNRLMGPNWERFLGLVCDPKHPAMAGFPTESCYDWQWRQVFQPFCRAINLNSLPGAIKPIVQMIDDWNRNHKLAAVFECRIGEGKLLMCAADLESDLSSRPAACQLRNSLLVYMASDAFNPSVEVTPAQLMNLRYDNRIMKKLGAIATASDADGRETVENLIDGNPNTFWTTAQGNGNNPHPHEVTIRFAAPIEMTGLVLMNRQNHREHEGDIRDYVIETSQDGKAWATVNQGQLESTFDVQTIDFQQTIRTAFLKIRAVSGFGGDLSASLAEIGILYTGSPLNSVATEAAQAYQKAATATEEMYEPVNVLEYSTNPTAGLVEQITCDSESDGDLAEYVLDGSAQTFWHTRWRDTADEHPHWLTLEFKKTVNLAGIRYLPRQDHPNGRIQSYTIEISGDGEQWHTASIGTFQCTSAEQTVRFSEVVTAKYLKLTAVSECRDQAFTSIAELSIIKAD